jgi:hypothetical protein
MAFATGKEARRKERETAEAWRNGGGPAEAPVLGPGAVKLDDKFKFMALTTSPKAGATADAGVADSAWDD